MRLITLVLFLWVHKLVAQQSIVSGHVNDFRTGEVLSGATIRQKGTNNAILTNRYGFFSMKLFKL